VKEALAKYLIKYNPNNLDLTGIDLSEADLSKVNLSEAYVSQANLSGVDLSWANLTNLSGVIGYDTIIR
jgi:uncharacterized protein YjbI with pentapeptide repeats